MTLLSLSRFVGFGALLATVLACGGGSGTAPANKFAFVASRQSSKIASFSVSASGALTPLGISVTTSANPWSLATTPNGRYLYSANNDGSIGQYSVGANGTLTPLTVTPVTAESCYKLIVSADGKYAYATAQVENKVLQFVIGEDGTLSPNTVSSVTTGRGPVNIILSADGQYAYTSNYSDSSVSSFAVNSDGTLTQNGSDIKVSLGPWDLGFSLSGSNLYVACWGANRIAQLAIGSDGKLSGMANTSVPGPTFCYALAVSPMSGQVYSGSHMDIAGIRRYSVASEGLYPGGLSEITPAFTSTPVGITSMTFSSQNVLYVCNETENKVFVYAPDSSGTLNQIDVEALSGKPYVIAFATR